MTVATQFESSAFTNVFYLPYGALLSVQVFMGGESGRYTVLVDIVWETVGHVTDQLVACVFAWRTWGFLLQEEWVLVGKCELDPVKKTNLDG